MVEYYYYIILTESKSLYNDSVIYHSITTIENQLGEGTKMRLLIGLLLVLFLVGSAMAVPITVEKVELDDVELFENGNNRFNVERDDTVEVEVLVTATEDTEIEVEVFISGFEYNDVARLGAQTRLFTLDANETKKLTLQIRIDQDVEEDNYRLRLLITDRDGTPILMSYKIKLDVPRHQIKIEDIILTPSGTVMAGQALLATVRLENQGEKDEDDVRVDFTIPALGISGTDYIDEIESDEEEETEEIFMRIPLCAEEGTYDADVEVTYNEGHSIQRGSTRVRIEANPMCAKLAADNQVDVIVEAQARPLDSPEQPAETSTTKSKIRKALETLVIILVGLLVIIALVIGFNKLNRDKEEEEEY